MKVFTLFIFFFSLQNIAQSQHKELQAIKVDKPPRIDGVLDDEAWKNIPVATDFIINQPQFGKASSAKTEVKMVYDNNAIYVSAHLYDSPQLIRKQLTARDAAERQDVDVFAVTIDTYNDKQNAFNFSVTAANVQSDSKISGGDSFDPSWDAVWFSRVNIVSDGWIVEMKIPYMSLRFSKNNLQDWGINFNRFMRRLNESSYWNPVNPQQSGFVNQLGLFKNLQNLTPPLRLSFLPFISLGNNSVPTSAGRLNNMIHNGGMDVKYGINQSFTMDMTLVPDFGSVQSDNVVLNLSPFELQFNENRPFFTEGTELFNKASIFYSRRVGSRPKGYYNASQLAADSNYSIIKNPSLTQLYNATKFSGRTKNNLGIGVFNAITAPMYAEMVSKKGDIIKLETEPLSNYNIIVLDKALKNRSSITFTNTNVIRSGGERNANVSAFDLSLFDKKNSYNWQLQTRYSNVTGTDAHTGYKLYTQYGKVSGIWQWKLWNNIVSKRYDPNDLGFLRVSNEFSTGGQIAFRQFSPNERYNYRNYNLSIQYKNLYQPFSYAEFTYSANFTHVYKNFWDITLELSGGPIWSKDYFELRKERSVLKKMPWAYTGLYGSTDSRKKLFLSYGAGYAFAWDLDYPFYLTMLGIRYRFNDKMSLDLNSRKEFDTGEIGYAYDDVTTNEPVAGLRRVGRMDNTLTGIYNFKARMNLTIRVRHFWSKVHYIHFYNADNQGNWLGNERLFEDGHDVNYNAFNLDAFYTWDFLPGSKLLIGWQNALGQDEAVDKYRYTKYTQNLGQSLELPHSNRVTMKLIYFIDYNKLKRKARE